MAMYGCHCGSQISMDGSDSILYNLPDYTVIESPHTHRGRLQLPVFWKTNTNMNAPYNISSGIYDDDDDDNSTECGLDGRNYI